MQYGIQVLPVRVGLCTCVLLETSVAVPLTPVTLLVQGAMSSRHHLGHCIQCPYDGNRFYNGIGWWDHMSSKHEGAPWYCSQLGIDSQLPTTFFKATNPSSTVTAVEEPVEATVPVFGSTRI